jgi:hypothetical protein
MTAARLVLERSTMMLLTSSKVSVALVIEVSIDDFNPIFYSQITDKSETPRMYIFQGES